MKIIRKPEKNVCLFESAFCTYGKSARVNLYEIAIIVPFPFLSPEVMVIYKKHAKPKFHNLYLINTMVVISLPIIYLYFLVGAGAVLLGSFYFDRFRQGDMNDGNWYENTSAWFSFLLSVMGIYSIVRFFCSLV